MVPDSQESPAHNRKKKEKPPTGVGKTKPSVSAEDARRLIQPAPVPPNPGRKRKKTTTPHSNHQSERNYTLSLLLYWLFLLSTHLRGGKEEKLLFRSEVELNNVSWSPMNSAKLPAFGSEGFYGRSGGKKTQSGAEWDYFSTMPLADLNFWFRRVDPTAWGGGAAPNIIYYLLCPWSSGTLLQTPDPLSSSSSSSSSLPLPHPLTTGSAVEVAGLDEIDNRWGGKGALWVDLRRVQLLLNDACLFDGDLLSTGVSTDLFR